MKIRGADFFAYLVSDLKRSAAFYRDTLGLPQTEYNEIEYEYRAHTPQ